MQINTKPYFVCAHTNARFDEALESIIKPFRNKGSEISWWSANSTTQFLHCTLLFCTASQNLTISDSDIAKEFINSAKKIKTTKLLKVNGYDITPSGFAILTLFPDPQLQKMHTTLLKNLTSLGLQPSQYSNINFLPHISIGKIINIANKVAALQELQQVFNSVNNAHIPFLAFDLELKTGRTSLSSKTLMRQDIGVGSVTHGKTKNIIHFANKLDAQNFANKLLDYYGIGSAKNPGKPKIVKLANNTHTVMLRALEFNKVRGHFNNLK